MAVTTFTTTAAEDARLAAWATASGFPSAKALITSIVKEGLQAYEQSANNQTYLSTYVPVNPT